MEIVFTSQHYFITKEFDGSHIWYQLWENGETDWFDTAKTLQEAIEKINGFEKSYTADKKLKSYS